ncbi:MAG: alginate export family protein [Thermoguttaceae bacterium]|nr:alginate export family protein [Thermoguttaceae bacterium]MDW8039390.1 alginate export family protein [Thermoguttaceae bacterium]
MWRQEVLRITLVGIIIGTVAVYLWKQAQQSPQLAQSSRSPPNSLGRTDGPGTNYAGRPQQTQTDPTASQSAVGEWPSGGPCVPMASSSGYENHSGTSSLFSEATSEPTSQASSPSQGSEAVPTASSSDSSGQEPELKAPVNHDSISTTFSPENSSQAPSVSPPEPPGLLPMAELSQAKAEQNVGLAFPEQPSQDVPEKAPLAPQASDPPEAPVADLPLQPEPANPVSKVPVHITGNQWHLRALDHSEPPNPSHSEQAKQQDPPPVNEELAEPLRQPTEASYPSGFRPNEELARPLGQPTDTLSEVSSPQGNSSSPKPQGNENSLLGKPSYPPVSEPSAPPELDCLSEKILMRPESLADCQPGGTCKQSTAVEQAARQAHQTLFYDNRFDYLDCLCPGETFLGDSLKRFSLTPWATLDVGGEYRLRHHSERNHRGQGLTGLDDDFLLHRTRLYANLELGELARVYAEMNDALSTNETYQPRQLEEDRTELQNLFMDVPILGFRSDGFVARLGRQELLYGAGRLVSPLDWANTRRTFEGYKLFWQGAFWTVDAFWVRPIYPNPEAFDSPDASQQFMGLYLVRRLGQQAVVEGYYLRLVEEDGVPDFDFHTFGFRSHQEYNGWLGELEAAIQFGSYGAVDHTAGMYTIGVGRRFSCLPGKPVFWMYYDWASGDPIQGNGFHHLFPDSHQYLGYMDLFGRRNIEDWNFQLLVHPHRDWTVQVAWHIFHRQHPLDVPYGVDMRPLVATPGGSGDYGQELDVVLQWAIRPRAELRFGYSRFFAGEFFRSNPSPSPHQDDADFFYTQFSLRF